MIRIDEKESVSVIKDHFFVKENHVNVKVLLNEITYVKADDNYLEIFTKSKKHLLRSSLRSLLNQLPQDQFIQVHRSFFINKEKVTAYTPSHVIVNDTDIPVSKQYQKTLSEVFNLI